MGPSHFTHVIVILMFGTGYMQVLYLSRVPGTKETLPDFREKCRVTRHSRVFRGLTGSQRTLGFWGVTKLYCGVYEARNGYEIRVHKVEPILGDWP